jgi:hypothetical protein
MGYRGHGIWIRGYTGYRIWIRGIGYGLGVKDID